MTTSSQQVRLLMLAVMGIAAVAAVVASPARAATFTVMNTNDSGAGSLRQAIADANAAPGADTVMFSISGTIALTSGALVVTDSLTIDGPGAASITVSGNNLSRILVANSAGVTLAVEDLTLANGRATFDGVILNNYGGAILNNGGTVTVVRSVLTQNRGGNGGAIENISGAVTISDTTFAGNSAGLAGGAIGNREGGRLTITSSTFSRNSGLPGGAIANYGVTATNASTATITNTSFAGNSAVVGGGIYNLMWARVRVTNSTFSGNTATGSQGGAIQNAGDTITLENSIFAGNACEGFTISDGGGNLDWPASSCPGVNADPRLGPLADNGGPTQTMAIGLGGGAIDAALAGACPATDQRGISRPQGAGCDIGAFESDAVDTTPPVITTPGNVVVNATGPAGAVVAYAASAVDDVDGPVGVTCSPPSGSTFSIGTTRVTCSASDAAGNEASASFEVHVKGSSEQLDDLIDRVIGIGPGSSLTDKLIEATSALEAGDKAMTCDKLGAFVNEAQAQSGKKLTPAEVAELVATASRVRAVLGCARRLAATAV